MFRRLLPIIVTVYLSIISIEGISVDALSVSAKACIMIEATTGTIIYEKNAHEILPMASTTKIMTTILSLESGDLDTEFTVDSEAIKVEGSSMGLLEGDTVTKRALCYGMMLPSGNDSANATAVKVGGSIENFVDMMNAKAQEIGMNDTLFVTPSGLDEGGHSSTAYDMAILARYALKNPDFREICSTESIQIEFGNPPYSRWLKNTNKLLGMYDGVIGVKTGFTDDAGRCLVSACERDGITLIAVTLNAPDDWNDHISLYNYGFNVVALESPDDTQFTVDVVGGISDNITVEPAEEVLLPTIDGNDTEYQSTIHVNRFEYAPITKGESLGYVEYMYNGEVIATYELIASENIKEYTSPVNLSPLQKIMKFIYTI